MTESCDSRKNEEEEEGNIGANKIIFQAPGGLFAKFSPRRFRAINILANFKNACDNKPLFHT